MPPKKITSKISRFKADLKKWGIWRSIYRRIMGRAKRNLGIHVHIIRITENLENPVFPCKHPNMTYRLMSWEDQLKAVDDPMLHLQAEFINKAKVRGDIVFGAYDGEKIVAYTWRSRLLAPHGSDLQVRCGKKYSYSYKTLTHPDYRGLRLMPSILLFSDAEMLKRGYSHRIGFVEVTNFESLASGKYMGSKAIGYAGYAKWFGRYFHFRTRDVRKAGFEFF